MALWLALVLATGPAPLEKVAKASSLIALGRITASRAGPAPVATLSIEFVVKGEETTTAVIADELHIGARGLFFLHRTADSTSLRLVAPKSWLAVWSEQPDSFRVFPEHVGLSRALLAKSKPAPYGGRIVPSAGIFAILGVEPRGLAQSPSYRVISATCSACVLEAEVARAAPAQTLDCGRLGESPTVEPCVSRSLESGRPFMVRQQWSGIDSGGTEAFVFGGRGAVRRISFDDDVTGGERPQCSSAVFSVECEGPEFRGDGAERALACRKTGAGRTLCSEWSSRSEVLSEPLPLATLKCDEKHVSCPEPLQQRSHLCRTGREGDLWCSPE